MKKRTVVLMHQESKIVFLKNNLHKAELNNLSAQTKLITLRHKKSTSFISIKEQILKLHEQLNLAKKSINTSINTILPLLKTVATNPPKTKKSKPIKTVSTETTININTTSSMLQNICDNSLF